MGSPTIFSGSRTKLISSKGLLLKDTSIIDNDGVPNFIKNGHAEIDATGWIGFNDQISGSTVASTDYVWVTTSDLAVGDAVSFPSVGTSGITANTIFYVIEKNPLNLKVSTTKGGSAFNITGDSNITIAKVRPIDGTGGTAATPWSRSTGNPLVGSGSFTFAKSAANRMGEGASYAFTVEPAYRARVINVQFDYILDSGTFTAGTSTTDSDVIVYLYDVTNSTLIEPSSFKLLSKSTSISDTFQSSFQTSATGSSYRLIFYIASASASAYTLKFDNIQVTPTEYAYGTPVTDWETWTPTLVSGNGTIVATLNGKKRRLGDSLELTVQYDYISGTGVGTNFYLSIPAGFARDTAKLQSSGRVGAGWYYSNTSGFKNTEVRIDSTGLFFTKDSVAGFILGTDADEAGASISISALIPILGWSSSVQMSDQTSTRVVDFVGSSAAGQSITANTTKFTFTAFKDSHSAWSTDTYTVPVAGDYSVSLSYYQTTFGAMAAYVHLNGADPGSGKAYLGVAGGSAGFGGSGTVILYNCKVGDAITIKGDATQTLSAGNRTLSISRISGPNQIAASEQIVARYTKSDASAFNGGGIRLFGNKVADTHGAYNTSTGLFTAPIAGFYHIDAAVQAASASYVAGGNARLYFSVAGSIVWGAEHISEAAFTGPKMLTASQTVYLLAGQTLGVITDGSVATNFAADATRNSLAIFLVK